MNKNHMKYLKHLKLYESYESKPEIFSHTIYRLPTQNELQEFENYDLSSEDIIKGFSYTIIGRGLASNKNKQMIIDSIKMLCDKYPNNQIYTEALSKIKKDDH
jgi:hypothetical protein